MDSNRLPKNGRCRTRIAAALILLPLAVLASGCGYQKSVTLYEGAERPAEEIAIFDCDGLCTTMMNLDTNSVRDLSHVDHFFVMEKTGKLYLEPGNYRFWIMYWGGKTPWADDYITSVTITLEAGHAYLVEGDVDCDYWGNDVTDIWITDETTDTAIVERKGLRHGCN